MNQRIAPVHIATQPTGPGFWHDAAWWALLSSVVVLGVAMAWWALRRARTDPLRSAFRRLARQQYLTRERREEFAEMAAQSGIPGAALLISAGARAEAAKRIARAARG